MNFEPHQLRVFAALMAERSVGRAAIELRTSPSNVRRIWTSLEQELGETLFDASERGTAAPTRAAERLEREMSGFLHEVRRLEDSIRSIHRTGRVLRLGADRQVFNTSHFSHLFNSLRHDRRFRISFVEVPFEEGRSALESGSCDLFFAIDGAPGRRFESRPMADLPLDVAFSRSSDDHPVPPTTLARWNWSLAAFSSTQIARQTLRLIQEAGGGTGSICSHNEFLRWVEGQNQPAHEAVVCIRPASFRRLSQISFQPLDLPSGYPLHVSYLKQHPFEFLESIVHQIARALEESTHGLRSTKP